MSNIQLNFNNPPTERKEFATWVKRFADLLMDCAPDEPTLFAGLKKLEETINHLPTEFYMTSKLDEANGEWSFDILPRIGRRAH